MRYLERSALFLALLVVCACGGGGSTGGTTALPQTTIGAAAASTQGVQLGRQPVSVTLPVIRQITGTLLFPAVDSPVTVALSVSAMAPDGVTLADNIRRARSGTLTVYEYITLVPPRTVMLPSIPAMTFHFPVSTPIAGKSFFYGLSNLNAQGGKVSFDTQGPGTVSGQTVSFAAIPTSVTLEAGHTYTFVVYATTTAVAATKIYLSSFNNQDPDFPQGSITTYNADGTPAAPTITGQLRFPEDVGVDRAGKIYVPAIGFGTGMVTTYAADGTPSTPTISAVIAPVGIAVDAAGKIYVANVGNTDHGVQDSFVSIYAPDGTELPTVIHGFSNPGKIAVDAAGKIYVATATAVLTFKADGTPTSPTITAGLNGPVGIAVDGAGKIYVTGQNNTVMTYNPDGTPSTPTLRAGLNGPDAVAVDASGKIYVANNAGHNITTYNPNGTQTSPTIATPINSNLTGLTVR